MELESAGAGASHLLNAGLAMIPLLLVGYFGHIL